MSVGKVGGSVVGGTETSKSTEDRRGFEIEVPERLRYLAATSETDNNFRFTLAPGALFGTSGLRSTGRQTDFSSN